MFLPVNENTGIGALHRVRRNRLAQTLINEIRRAATYIIHADIVVRRRIGAAVTGSEGIRVDDAAFLQGVVLHLSVQFARMKGVL